MSTKLTVQQCADVVGMSSDFIIDEIRGGRLQAQQFRRPSGRTRYRIEPGAFDAWRREHWKDTPTVFHVETKPP